MYDFILKYKSFRKNICLKDQGPCKKNTVKSHYRPDKDKKIKFAVTVCTSPYFLLLLHYDDESERYSQKILWL